MARKAGTQNFKTVFDNIHGRPPSKRELSRFRKEQTKLRILEIRRRKRK